jgi:hypothetical protein
VGAEAVSRHLKEIRDNVLHVSFGATVEALEIVSAD